MRQALKWSHDINSALKVNSVFESFPILSNDGGLTDANNLGQNKVIIYRITSKHTWRKTWVGKKRKRTKPGNADKSSNPAMMNELHNMNPPLLFPLNQVQIYELNLKIQCTKVPTNGCWARRADVMSCLPNESHQNKLWACIEMLVRA